MSFNSFMYDSITSINEKFNSMFFFRNLRRKRRRSPRKKIQILKQKVEAKSRRRRSDSTAIPIVMNVNTRRKGRKKTTKVKSMEEIKEPMKVDLKKKESQ